MKTQPAVAETDQPFRHPSLPTPRAAQIVAPGRVISVEITLRDPAPGEVLIRVEGCGVCASNLEPWAGPSWMSFPLPPGDLGHEAWGTVMASGSAVTGFQAGDRVAYLGSRSYATHEIVAARNLMRLPAELDGQPFPAEPLGCAMNIFRRSRIEAGQTIAILGIGFLGAVLTRLASEAGARVIALSRRETSLALARDMGAVATVTMGDFQQSVAEVAELTEGRLCDVTIEAVGRQGPLDLAGALLRESGRLVIAGYHQDGPRQVDMLQWNWRAYDIVNAHERDPAVQMQGMRMALDAVLAGQIDPAPLLTHVYALEELGAALDATRDKPGHFVKALIRCR
jgi:threonine dehydrogenase-like Zn-dependent dehydrogenase